MKGLTKFLAYSNWHLPLLVQILLRSLVLDLQLKMIVQEREEEVEELQGSVYVVHVVPSSQSHLVL
jgi:hypothetical protein